MLSDNLLTELYKLNRTEKLRVVQILINELASEEARLRSPGRDYEVWSPHDSPDTTRELLNLLENDLLSKQD